MNLHSNLSLEYLYLIKYVNSSVLPLSISNCNVNKRYFHVVRC